MITAIDIIAGAREMLADPKNWCRKGGHGDNGEICVVVALSRVGWGMGTCITTARDAVRSHLPDKFFDIVSYNDDPHTTHQDILNLLDKTLADLGGLA